MNPSCNVRLIKEDNLLKRFEEIHDYIYANDGLSPQQTLEEFVKILFIRIYDENENCNQFTVSANEWRTLKSGKTNQAFIERITNLFELTKQAYADVFDNDDKIKLTPITLGFTVNKLQNISLLNSSQDANGLAFQKFLSHHEKDGQGQFFTPEPVVNFCVEMIQPGPGETIIDPACGSGGFLLSALKYLKRNNSDFNTSVSVSNHLWGLDINKSITRIARMKLLLEFNGKTNIICANSLEDPGNIKLPVSQKEGFDIVLTNPPFGAKITNTSILSEFDLGHKWSGHNHEYHKTKAIYPTRHAEILFIEKCIQLLKEGGRMAIVLPNGDFENPSLEYLRYYIKSKTKILAIVNLPQETFIPFGTGVKTSLLFLEKDSAAINKRYSVFFGRVTKPGYQGNKNGTPLYKKDKYGQVIRDSNGEPVPDEDFSPVVKAYKEFRRGNVCENENTFSINYSEIKTRFDFDFYSPANRKLLSHPDNVKTVRLGDICDIVKTKSKKLKDKNLTVEYVELSDINTYSYEIINSTTCKVHELPGRASYELREGDIITAIAGNSVGTRKHATALVTRNFEGNICTNGFRILRNFKTDSYYLLYFLRTEMFLKQMFICRTGAAIPVVSDKDLSDIIIWLPDEKIINEISKKMRKAFELRQESEILVKSVHL